MVNRESCMTKKDGELRKIHTTTLLQKMRISSLGERQTGKKMMSAPTLRQKFGDRSWETKVVKPAWYK